MSSYKKVIELEKTESTNDHAAELLKNDNLPEGSIIFTNDQTAGKGQRGNSWICAEGKDLAMTLIF
ncbi:MAG: hypothetical protein ABEH43_06350, partial [Flavobacteriales bacterium]